MDAHAWACRVHSTGGRLFSLCDCLLQFACLVRVQRAGCPARDGIAPRGMASPPADPMSLWHRC